ncbi:MAG: hypothetical protein A2033_04160 [Bacteroidetes bacterium GWA2_31_9]|nr:MAG: hypothetical protein A2033_04160 [Bacteroidetes bacterium GWA2_31_9]
MNKLYCLVIFVVLVILSCNNSDEKYKKIDFTLETTQTTNPEITEAKINLDLSLISNEILLEINGSVFFKATVNDKEIAQNNKGCININSSYYNSSEIIVTSYNSKLHYTIEKDDLGEGIIFLTIYQKINAKELKQLISIYEKSSDGDVSSQPVFTKTKNKIFSHGKIPILKIYTKNQCITDSTKIISTFELFDKKKDNKLTDNPKKTGYLKIKIRGSSSKLFPKQSYLINSFNDSLKKDNIKLMGLPKENEWVLYAPFVDISLIRNVLSYKLHREMGNYSPRTRFCHLIINDEYRGIYVLTESIKVDKNRVNISELSSKDSDISGGYIIKLDKGNGKAWKSPFNAQIDTGFSKWFIYVSPNEKQLTDNQANYIKEYITNFEKAIVENGNWKEYIDIKSFIDYQILMEVSKNVDAYRLSMYFSKDKGGLLKIEPVWDMNFTFGLTSYFDGYKTDGLMYLDKATPFWWNCFMKDREYKMQFLSRWKELRTSVLSDKNVNGIIDSNYMKLLDEVDYNALKWNTYNDKNMWRKYDHKNFKESIDYIKSWTQERLKWLDNVFRE